MLDSPAARIAQHGSMLPSCWPRGKRKQDCTRTKVRSLWPSIQDFQLLARPKAFHNISFRNQLCCRRFMIRAAQLRGERCAPLPESVLMRDVCGFLAQFSRQHFLR